MCAYSGKIVAHPHTKVCNKYNNAIFQDSAPKDGIVERNKTATMLTDGQKNFQFHPRNILPTPMQQRLLQIKGIFFSYINFSG